MNQQHIRPASQPQDHTRINNTLLGPVEKRALLWLAARMPAWVTPDTLTGLGLFASLLIFFSYALTSFTKAFLWLACFGFLLQWLGDSLDGTLARYRKIERPRYGFFVDHVIDGVSEAFIFLGLGLSPYVRFDLALVALVAYLILSIYVYLVTYVNGVFRISYARLGPTEFRVVAVAANIFVFAAGNPHLQISLPYLGPLSVTFYDLVAVAVAIILLTMFAVSTILTAQELSREDRSRVREDRARMHEDRTWARSKNSHEERNRHKTGARKETSVEEELPIPATSKNR